ncbi:hypothetical protein EDB85DRAFT_2279962 [Lactarius pseudohatsudake]|nr:hypothetical protein EDB85DRAFT_2279962 [Lactarius pseudohatsudake]
MRLGSNMARGHFLGLGPSSNQDALFVSTSSRSLPPNAGEATQKEVKAKEERRRHNPIVFEYVHLDVHLMDKTTFGSNTGSILWKQVSISKQQRHFSGGRHGLFDYGKLSQAHVLKLGRSGTGLIALALSPFDVLSTFAPTTVTVELSPLRQVGVRGTDVPEPFVLDCVYHPMLLIGYDTDGIYAGESIR